MRRIMEDAEVRDDQAAGASATLAMRAGGFLLGTIDGDVSIATGSRLTLAGTGSGTLGLTATGGITIDGSFVVTDACGGCMNSAYVVATRMENNGTLDLGGSTMFGVEFGSFTNSATILVNAIRKSRLVLVNASMRQEAGSITGSGTLVVSGFVAGSGTLEWNGGALGMDGDDASAAVVTAHSANVTLSNAALSGRLDVEGHALGSTTITGVVGRHVHPQLRALADHDFRIVRGQPGPVFTMANSRFEPIPHPIPSAFRFPH